jgi:anti-sigma factor RsiW
MSTRSINPEQGPTSRQRAAFTDGGLTPEQCNQVRAWLAGHPNARTRAVALAEADRHLLRLFRASRPEEPSPDTWEQSLLRIESALLVGDGWRGNAERVQALGAPLATGTVASIRREQS